MLWSLGPGSIPTPGRGGIRDLQKLVVSNGGSPEAARGGQDLLGALQQLLLALQPHLQLSQLLILLLATILRLLALRRHLNPDKDVNFDNKVLYLYTELNAE